MKDYCCLAFKHSVITNIITIENNKYYIYSRNENSCHTINYCPFCGENKK